MRDGYHDIASVFTIRLHCYFPCRSFFDGFGGFRFNFGGGGDGGHREVPRGGTIHMDMEVSLEDLYKGNFIEVREEEMYTCV